MADVLTNFEHKTKGSAARLDGQEELVKLWYTKVFLRTCTIT